MISSGRLGDFQCDGAFMHELIDDFVHVVLFAQAEIPQ